MVQRALHLLALSPIPPTSVWNIQKLGGAGDKAIFLFKFIFIKILMTNLVFCFRNRDERNIQL